MDEVMRNAKIFLGLIQSAKTEVAASWKTEAFQRAVQWAEYFEGVHRKLESKPAVVIKFNRGLGIISSQPGASPGPSPVTFDDLKQSRRMLLKILLQNPYISSELFSRVLDTYNNLPSLSDGSTGKDMLNQDATECAHIKAVRETLLKLKALTSKAVERTTQKSKSDHPFHTSNIPDLDRQMDAVVLHQHILHHLTYNPQSQSTCDYLHDKLHQAAKKPHGIKTIERAASIPPPQDAEEQKEDCHETNASSISDHNRCRQFISDWLAKNKTKYKPNMLSDNR